MSHMYSRTSAFCLLVCCAVPAFAQTVALPQAALEKQRRISDASYYKKWLAEDVGYIASDEERIAFKSLRTDASREQFVEQFWRRRDPTPDTVENEYREEYYQRLAYANEQFATDVPGWKTDRGIVYIKYGPPDERTVQGGANGGVPYERWFYHYMENFAPNVEIEFVDGAGSGDFRVSLDPPEREALLGPGGAAQAWCKQMGPCKPTQLPYLSTSGSSIVLAGAQLVEPPKMNVKLAPAPVAKF
jgi:GWxTD domain-containing protein